MKVKYYLSSRKFRQIVIGGGLLMIIILCAVFAPLIAPYDPSYYNVTGRLAAPSGEHLFGTDAFGRDVFSRVIYGARVTLAIGLAVTIFCGAAGIIIGLVAGYYKKAEAFLMRIMDAMMAFPNILLALVIVAVLGPGMWNIIVALTISAVPRVARMVRGVALTVKELDHVAAARSTGATDVRLLLIHILPLCASPIIVILTLILANTALAEASLTFLGVGLPPEIPSWGNIISEGRAYMDKAPWLTVFPGFSILLSVLALNILGDGVRDLMDPRLRNL